MNRWFFIRGFVVVFGVLLIAAGNASYAQDKEGNAPYEGQEGKDVGWVATDQKLVDKMLDMAGLTPQDYLIDLGSGDGRTVITAAKRGARALGIEYNPDLVDLSKQSAVKEGVSDKAEFIKADLFESDFSRASVITMFLLPDINMKLRPRLLNLKPGIRIVSNSFKMEDWIADQIATIPPPCVTWCTAYLWIVPAKAGGKWRLDDGELEIRQKFQTISGKLRINGKSMDISGKLAGDLISFTAAGTEYNGQITGDSISGTRSSGEPWKAIRQ